MHLCNAFFEWELESSGEKSLEQWLTCSPIIQKLQYLPLQYGKKEDAILVTKLPENPDPRLHLISHPPPTQKPLESWGASLAIAKWAAQHHIPYRIPSWEVVKKINSKIFSYQQAPQLRGAALLKSYAEVIDWSKEMEGPLVLKAPQGVAGRGHFFVGQGNLQAFLQKQPIVIGEPWMNRIFDFSTQWKIENGIEYLGATILENKANGGYLSNRVWEKCDFEWALKEHLEIAKPILQKIEHLSFFGHLGIDAFVYSLNGKEHLHSIVEINARKTMGWVILPKNSN